MILVTGGCFQGKTDYACETFGIPMEEAADGASCPLEELYQTRLLYHFHEYIRRLLEENLPFSVEKLKAENPEIILVTREDLIVPLGQLCKDAALEKVSKVVVGGDTRTQSVLAGLREAAPGAELIAIHDAARPLVSLGVLNEVVE